MAFPGQTPAQTAISVLGSPAPRSPDVDFGPHKADVSAEAALEEELRRLPGKKRAQPKKARQLTQQVVQFP